MKTINYIFDFWPLLCLCLVPGGPPENFSVTHDNYTTVCLAWDRPIASEENGILTGYTITYNGSREEKQLVS